jgi:hypothetical protein
MSQSQMNARNSRSVKSQKGLHVKKVNLRSLPCQGLVPVDKQPFGWTTKTEAFFREVGMLLYTQGIKPSDNLIFRAALRLMPRDHRLMEQIQVLVEKDERRQRHRDKHAS